MIYYICKEKEKDMREEKINELKNIRAALLEFAKGEKFGEWDTNGREIKNALKSLAIAIEDSEKRAEKRYVGIFYNAKNTKTREEYKIPFYSKYKVGSFMNKNDAWNAQYQYCKENGLKYEDIKFSEAYRERA